jgi:hypothetical protein
VRGQEVEGETVFGDYKEVGGLIFPHSIQSKPKGAPEGTGVSISIASIEINPDLPASRFEMPAKAAVEPPKQQ